MSVIVSFQSALKQLLLKTQSIKACIETRFWRQISLNISWGRTPVPRSSVSLRKMSPVRKKVIEPPCVVVVGGGGSLKNQNCSCTNTLVKSYNAHI